MKKHSITQKKHQHGVVSIEFSIGSIFLFYVFFLWAEICIMGFISSSLDYSISEASRVARTSSNSDYKAIFEKELNKKTNLWANFLDTEKFEVSVRYFDSFDQISDDNVTGGDDRENKPIALYRVSYDYSLVFSGYFSRETVTLSREVFGVQEFERNEFSQ
ncbi:pilus assembly protein TadE [Enterovibrio norvegicus]|uniref:TadE/TadG family type IV pilus assembly protein n=1 Tax=Enterovibrio norvegicus TaxID=188144 RepID=UPI000C816E63|nr:pilus assembly protein [Enterovibrio norvegicus]MCC4797729.1 pilus assembly protein [Enterovibrio norvegicus]PMH61030.1 pilus assembly protein TadE [Enterovibrio norvegicus]PMI32745.1 pilus assembly protein TadE [Enterovibrio norvegicus]PMI38817.1 pilus assembly protein TadE [Enterovibrio norvegicus]PMN45564.1 pilus assembly protein TadE [Enterovibrio norvegicus]